jgi:Tfp pilus assembly protein PilN
MNVRDWAPVGVLLLGVGSVLAQLAISVALRRRDREDFLDLRGEHDQLRKEHDELSRQLAQLKGRLGDRS